MLKPHFILTLPFTSTASHTNQKIFSVLLLSNGPLCNTRLLTFLDRFALEGLRRVACLFAFGYRNKTNQVRTDLEPQIKGVNFLENAVPWITEQTKT